jgi:hypothetical protein
MQATKWFNDRMRVSKHNFRIDDECIRSHLRSNQAGGWILIAFGATNGRSDEACVLNAYALKKWEDPCRKA